MNPFLRAIIALLITSCSVAQAESRFVGMFYANRSHFIVDTGDKVPKPKVVMPTGHLPGANLTLPPHTMKRFASKTDQLTSIFEAASKRFYQKLKDVRGNRELIRLAKEIAPRYRVEPAALVAAILGELTFNNDFSMGVQNFASRFLAASQSFYPGADELDRQLQLPQLQLCEPEKADYWAWVCVSTLWDNNVMVARGKPNILSSFAYIPMSAKTEPFARMISPKLAIVGSAGLSFGPAQITLLRALMSSADVSRVSGGKYPVLTLKNMPAVQSMIADTEASLHITAATLGRSIYAYRKYPRVDISENLGLLATIFNVGSELPRAIRMRDNNTFRKAEELDLPKENYFGYFINEHEKEIRSLFETAN